MKISEQKFSIARLLVAGLIIYLIMLVWNEVGTSGLILMGVALIAMLWVFTDANKRNFEPDDKDSVND